MTQYLLSVHGDEAANAEQVADPAAIEKLYAQVDAFNQRVRDSGAWVFAGGLQPTSTAAVVHGHNDAAPTEGPRNSVQEPLGGFWVIEAANREAALAWAHEASAACEAPVELRPFQEEPEA